MNRKKVILIVDDERIVLDSIKRQLKEIFGDKYSYEIAQSGSEALELIEELQEEEHHIILILTDFIMPNMRGDEFLKKAHVKLPKTSKIILTGQADETSLEKVKQEINLLAVLTKPWTEEQLIQHVQKGINAY